MALHSSNGQVTSLVGGARACASRFNLGVTWQKLQF